MIFVAKKCENPTCADTQQQQHRRLAGEMSSFTHGSGKESCFNSIHIVEIDQSTLPDVRRFVRGNGCLVVTFEIENI